MIGIDGERAGPGHGAGPAFTRGCGVKNVSVREIRTAVDALQERRRRRCLVEAREAARVGGVARPVAGGTVDMRVHPTSFHYWGQRIGYGCWEDKGFQREYKRDVPEARVRTVCTRATLNLASAPRENLQALFGADGRMRRNRGNNAAPQ